ncbi:MAG: peptidase associated/transthyretin-like domain-containing protein [Solirubrobacteraceae bacterium]
MKSLSTPSLPMPRRRGARSPAKAAAAGTLAAALIALASAQAANAEALAAGLALPAGVVANGVNASLGAVIEPPTKASFQRTYQQSALVLHSRLLNAAGQPIGGAKLEILQRRDGESALRPIGSAVTAADGRFTAKVPAGPSRTVVLAYRPYEGAARLAVQSEVSERVSAGVQLTVAPRRTRPTGRITLHGHVLGEVPRSGVVVEVLVYYQGRWEPIRTPRSTPSGQIRVSYRFDHASGQFPFALRVRSGQAGFPYATGCSGTVEVVARR